MQLVLMILIEYVPITSILSDIILESNKNGIVFIPSPYEFSLPIGVNTTVACCPLKLLLVISTVEDINYIVCVGVFVSWGVLVLVTETVLVGETVAVSVCVFVTDGVCVIVLVGVFELVGVTVLVIDGEGSGGYETPNVITIG